MFLNCKNMRIPNDKLRNHLVANLTVTVKN